MSEFDWMLPVAYDRVQDAEMTGLAWECLRRNQDFQRDHRTVTSAQASPVSPDFRQRWGLCFRGRS
jgi:transcriptional regulator